MSRNRLFLTGLMVITVTSSGFAGIIDDKSQFVGDYTVIDFETRGGGTPLILEDGAFTKIPDDEYAAFGITITASYDAAFDNYWPVVGNSLSSQFDAAQVAAGSPENVVADRTVNGFLRLDFTSPVNSLGVTVIDRTDGGPVRLEVFDSAGGLLDSLSFDETVIDGIIRGEEFGTLFDIEYGFFGLFIPGEEIAHAIITEGSTTFDDLHFGAIPEPATVAMLVAGVGFLAIRRKRTTSKGRRQLSYTWLLLLAGDLSWTVPTFAGIIDDKSDFVGDYTVIDFETRGDGSPLSIDEGEWRTPGPEEYAPFGVTITSSINVLGEPYPILANMRSDQFDAAQALAGSPTNSISAISLPDVDRFLRFDFDVPVSAIGLTVINSVGYGVPELRTFDDSNTLIGSVTFADTLIDGIILGEDYGELFDIAYGFMGIAAQDAEISWAIADAGGTSFDDLHFGAIPEPATVAMLVAGVGFLAIRRKRPTSKGRRQRSYTWLLLLAAIIMGNAASFDDLHFGVIPEPSTLIILGAASLLAGVCHRRGRGVVVRQG